jgi:arylsulfatase A-like enzyme
VQSDKKNIIVVSFDDCMVYWKHRDCFGLELQTPNLDRFCDQATVFNSAYCQSPICGPSRASFMSGRTPYELDIHTNKIDVFDRITPIDMWSHKLRQDGYYCSSGGKVHHYYRPLRRQFHRVLYDDAQKRFGSDNIGSMDVEKIAFGGSRRGLGTVDPKDDVVFYDHQSAESVISFLQNYNSDRPFYREVGFRSPHGPWYTPVRFKEMYDYRKFWQPKSWAEGFDETDYAREHYPENIDGDDIRLWRKNVRNYFSSLTHGDYHFGRFWDAFQASPYAKNTVVIVLTDHGFHLGNRNQFKKTTLWEQVAGVPMMIYDPERAVRRDVHDPVALLDVGPTALDYAGLPPLDKCQGKSLRPLIDGGSDADRVVPTFHYDNAAIRKGQYRLIRYKDGSTELYDLDQDYWQLRNLGRDHPAHTDMLEALEDTCSAYGYGRAQDQAAET